MSVFHRETTDKRSENNNDESKNPGWRSSSEARAWVSERGHGEGCQRCYSQTDVHHVPADGGCVTLCADCRPCKKEYLGVSS